ncbi:hypothetical protein F2Q68_00023804 [Brassica cretica]|uniref:Plastid lipid-associated protein/fibrillin conserved domain-containing protein n=1 Tax=Brassica cretica TaxID=69181 RepID=A0A8S9IF36_BRACR|nr:hypothetical protein F2Q68_00023804 [Brassica cretica]
MSSSSMALVQSSIPGSSAVRLSFSNSMPPPSKMSQVVVPMVKGWRRDSCRRRALLRAMVQEEAVQGSPSVYARDMERLSAKESLLLALKDAGGFEALVTGKTTSMQRIDVNERITSLERLNPSPRPTTSPCFEGKWNFEWFGSGSPGLLAEFDSRFVCGSIELLKLNAATVEDESSRCPDGERLEKGFVSEKGVVKSNGAGRSSSRLSFCLRQRYGEALC